MSTVPPSATPEAALRSVHTTTLPALFDQLHVSLLVSTYQAGKVIVVRSDGGVLNTHFRPFAKPMGMAAAQGRLTIGGTNTVWEYRNVPAVARTLEPPDKHDACYVPRRLHVTGDIDIHELAYAQDHTLWVVNTRFSCLCTLDADHSFHPRWRPPFVRALAPEDRCHLNGLGMVDGRPRYVTALGTTDTPGGWRANKARGGVLMDLDTNAIILHGLAMPHSPRWYQGQLWVLESGQGTLARVDLERGRWETVAQLPGFTRGLDFWGPLAFIGLSQVRESAVFSGIPLVERLQERTCGVWVVHIETGQTVGFVRFEAGVQEIFAVQVLPGTRFPEVLEWGDARLAHTYVLPDDAMAEVALPTAEELARSPATHFQRGTVLHRAGQVAEAIAAYRQCVALQPDYPHARYHLGVALGDAEHYDEALVWLQQVIAAEPEHAEAYHSLGYCYSSLGQPTQAMVAFERAIALQPQYVQAHINLGLTLLQLGDYPRGFTEYEWRWQTGQTPPRGPQPRWDGRPLPDQTLLVYAEQGAGDAIQFARYLPQVAERCKRLLVACPADLQPLLATLPGIAQLCDVHAFTVAEYDAYVPLLSLPQVFGTTLATIPATVPYFDVAALRRRTNPDHRRRLTPSTRPAVGIVWAGSPTHPHDRHRSCALREWLPLLRLPGIAFYSLQKGERQHDVTTLPPEIRVQALAPALHDFGDLAMCLTQIDLVITVDTAVAHLAGALGRPVWVLLPAVPDWRWGLAGEQTPWYPTMRLFRQTRAGDWAPVLQRVAQTLATWREVRRL
jgi:uncharacterized protein (TIGR03032 family)